MQTVWAKALFLQPPRVMGTALRPFSLAHGVALLSLGNAFVCGGEITPMDLYMVLQVCRRTREELRRDFFSMALKWRVTAWMLSMNRRQFERAVDAVDVYISDALDAPLRSESQASAKESFAAPYEFHLHRVLCKTYGYAPEAAWNESYITARCLCDTDAEANGDKTLVDEMREQIADKMLLARAAYEAGDKAKADTYYAEADALAKKNRGVA